MKFFYRNRCECLESLVFGAADDFVLEGFADVVEVVAVACHADDQASILFGILLRFAQRLGVHHVELDVMAVHLEVCPHEAHHFINAGFVFEELRGEFLVQQRSACAEVIHLRDGFDHRRGSVRIRPLHWRKTTIKQMDRFDRLDENIM